MHHSSALHPLCLRSMLEDNKESQYVSNRPTSRHKEVFVTASDFPMTQADEYRFFFPCGFIQGKMISLCWKKHIFEHYLFTVWNYEKHAAPWASLNPPQPAVTKKSIPLPSVLRADKNSFWITESYLIHFGILYSFSFLNTMKGKCFLIYTKKVCYGFILAMSGLYYIFLFH